MDPGSWQEEVEGARQQFVIHFVQTAQQLLTNEKVDLSIKQKILTFLSGAIGAGAALAIPSGSLFASEVFKAGKHGAEAGLNEYEKISTTNKKLELDHTLTALSSSHKNEEKLTKFRKLCIEMALEIFHAYDYQLRSVYRKISDSSTDRIQAIQMLGQYAGAQCFSQLSKMDVNGGVFEGGKIYEHLCKGDDGFLDKTKSIMDILKSMYESWTTHKLYMQPPDSTNMPTKSTDTRTFFKNPIPAYSSQDSCENLKTTEAVVGAYVWFQSQKFCELMSARKQKKFKMMMLRRPFKFEWTHWRQCSTGEIKIDAFEHRDFFWADQSKATEILYGQILPALQTDNEKLLTHIHHLTFQMGQGVQTIKSHTSKEVAEGVQTINSYTSKEVAELKKILTPAQQDQSNMIPPSSCLPPTVVPIFVGRQNIIEKLQEILPFKNFSRKSTCSHDRIVVLAGQGGIGKTEASKKFALDWPGPKFFIKAESFDLLKSSFVGLAKEHKILEEITKKFQISETDVEDIARGVYDHFSNLGDSLFIFDNAEQLKSTKESAFGIRPFLPLHQRQLPAIIPAVLITSRLKVWGTVEKLKVIEMPYLVREDGHKFFCQAFNLSEDQKNNIKESLEKLVQWLGGLPLAMKLAAGYILESNIGVMTTERLGEAIQEYLELFETDPQKLMDIEDESVVYSEQKVGTVWEKSWDKIANFPNKNMSDTAIQFLKWMSYMETEAIWAKLLSILYHRIIGKVINDGNWNCSLRDLEDALCLLERYSMISIEREPDGGISEYSKIGIHRLVQKWAQTKAEVDSKCLVDLATHIKNEDGFKASRVKIHNALKRRGWPEDTFAVSMCWAIENRTLCFVYGRDEILLDVYAHLIGNNEDDAIWTKLTAVRMNLVEIKYNRHGWVIDNKDLFDELDPLYDFNTNKICGWLFQLQTMDTLSQVLRQDDVNTSIDGIINGIGVQGLVTELDHNTIHSIITWITKNSHLDDDHYFRYFVKYYRTVLDESHVENLLKFVEMEYNAHRFSSPSIIESMAILLAKAPELEHRMMDYLDKVVRAWIASSVKQSHGNTSLDLRSIAYVVYGMKSLAEEKRWRPLLYNRRKHDQIGMVETFIQALPQILAEIKNMKLIFHVAYVYTTLLDWALAFSNHREMAVLLQSSGTCMADLQKTMVVLQDYVTTLNNLRKERRYRDFERSMSSLTELQTSLQKMCNSNRTKTDEDEPNNIRL